MRWVPAIVGLVTLITLGLWIGTDRHFYTKFEVVETVSQTIDPDDPLAGTGFYDGETAEVTVTRSEFHLGLLPTPSGLLDKHALSVVSILGPTWVAALGWWWLRRRSDRARGKPERMKVYRQQLSNQGGPDR
jgi:hypothetical protein